MKKVLVCLMLTGVFCTNPANACTNFQVKAKDSSVVVGRTMEFPVDLKSVIWVIPRGIQTTSIADDKTTGLSWKNKYGFLAIDGFNLSTSYVEGLNEKGLTVGGLMYTGAKYQKVEPGKFITYADFISWALGNFATVDELKKELPKIKVVDKYIKDAGGSLGLHFAIHDASGQAMVVEFIDGEQKIYDNPVGVLTNRPDFSWQLTNLRNYINLTPSDKEPKKVNGFYIEPTGVGSGMLGLPGDWTPPSRFVKMTYLVDSSLKPKDSKEAVNLSEHLINAIDIPKGAIKETVKYVFHIYGNAQWSIIKDLDNKALYFRTYDSMVLRKISLNELDLKEGTAKKSVQMSKEFPSIIDINHALR